MQTEFLLRCFPTRPTLFMPLKMLRSIQGDAYKGSSEQLLFLWDRVFHGVQKPSSPGHGIPVPAKARAAKPSSLTGFPPVNFWQIS